MNKDDLPNDDESDDLRNALEEMLQEAEKNRWDNIFTQFCFEMQKIPSDYKPVAKNGFKSDIELQPIHWLRLGNSLISSYIGVSEIQDHQGGTGRYIQQYLEFPVFHLGCEYFLKGIWLCQFAECRHISWDDYIEPQIRKKHFNDLKEQGHDLIKLIDALREIEPYKNDQYMNRFFKIIEGVIRSYYFPLYDATKNSGEWAKSRYPIRFYKDPQKTAKADNLKNFPEQRPIQRLFEETQDHLVNLWKINP